jgi:hypothetical protein
MTQPARPAAARAQLLTRARVCSVEHWEARRHRRNLLPHEAGHALDEEHQDAYNINPFHHHAPYRDADAEALYKLRWISFFVGQTFLSGSMLFVLGAVAGEFPAFFDGSWGTDTIDDLVNIPYVVRAACSAWRL